MARHVGYWKWWQARARDAQHGGPVDSTGAIGAAESARYLRGNTVPDSETLYQHMALRFKRDDSAANDSRWLIKHLSYDPNVQRLVADSTLKACYPK